MAIPILTFKLYSKPTEKNINNIIEEENKILNGNKELDDYYIKKVFKDKKSKTTKKVINYLHHLQNTTYNH